MSQGESRAKRSHPKGSHSKEAEAIKLDLGPDVIQRLIPHRPPFLLVDRVISFSPGASEAGPTLWARRHISPNEAIFAGHFPGLSLWPGVYTIEGMGQSCNLLMAVRAICAHMEAQGESEEEGIKALRSMEAQRALRAGPSDHRRVAALEALFADQAPPTGLSGAVDVKLLTPVFAGQRLDYRVTLSRAMGEVHRFEVEASVEGQPVARGAMTAAVRPLGFSPSSPK